MKKPFLYIMCGLPFSGKTELAKKIAEKTGAKMIAFDWIWAEKKRELIPDLDKIEEWKFILNEAHKRIRQTLLENKSVVYDDISVRKEHRDALRTVARESNSSFAIVFLNTPMSLIRKREAENKTSKERHEVAYVNFNKAIRQWQQPLGEENVVEYKPDMGLEELLGNLEKHRI